MTHKILIVDDDDRIRGLIRTVLELEDEDFDIYEAKNGEEALDLARETVPHLIILDVMMPGMSGYEVCKCIKISPETENTYVIFLTGRGSPISKNTIEISGGDELMIKPFMPEELCSKVKKALGLI